MVGRSWMFIKITIGSLSCATQGKAHRWRAMFTRTAVHFYIECPFVWHVIDRPFSATGFSCSFSVSCKSVGQYAVSDDQTLISIPQKKKIDSCKVHLRVTLNFVFHLAATFVWEPFFFICGEADRSSRAKCSSFFLLYFFQSFGSKSSKQPKWTV